MGNFLANVGRSNVGTTAFQTVGAINALRQTEANVALNQAQLDRIKNIDAREQQEAKEANTPMPIESFSHRFEGGEQGPMFKMVYDYVDKSGFIDKSQGGLGAVRKGDYKEITELISEPNFVSKLSRTRIDYWRGQLNQVKTAMQEKPDDQKLQTAFQQADTGLKQALFQDKAMADALEAEAKAKTEAEKPQKWVPETKEEALELKQAGRPQTNISLGTGAKTTLEKNIIETQSQIDSFNEIENMFEDEYLTYQGRVRAKAEIFTDKLGMPISKEWLTKRTQWFQITKERFLAYRKWVTGVAGGKEEMKEIAKAYFDPETNSPTQFRANLRQSKINAIRLQKRYRMFLEMGITPTKKQLSTIPFSQIQLTPQELESVANIGGQFEEGVLYEDAHGTQKEYLGNGRWSD